MNKKLLVVALFIGLLASCGSKTTPTKSSTPSNNTSSVEPIKTELNTEQTDKLKLTTDFTNKKFTEDGIGEVKFASPTDGDTANFRMVSGGESFPVRFLGINTPESTAHIEPWGKKASRFTKEKLSSAYRIVLENQVDVFGKFDNNGKRYLGFVWYQATSDSDFRLLNLELVEEAYSLNQCFKGKYIVPFQDGAKNASLSGRRIYGEIDEDYDYSKTVAEISIYELQKNWTEYAATEDSDSSGKRIRIEGMIVDMIGDNLVLRDAYGTPEDDGTTTYGGIYCYAGYNSGLSSWLEIGDVIKMYCNATERFGARQLTNLAVSSIGKEKIVIVSKGNTFEPRELTTLVDEPNLEGAYVKVGLTVTQAPVAAADDTESFTVKAKITGTNEVLNIRVDKSVQPGYDRALFTAGASIEVKGCIVTYYETKQLLLGNNVPERHNLTVL